MSEKISPFLMGKFRDNETERQLAEKRHGEQRTAEALAFDAAAYMSMPEDLRSRSKVWGVSSLMEAVWMHAFECGYKQANRDRAALSQGRQK